MPQHPVSRTVKGMFRPLKPYQIIVDVIVAGLFAAIAAPLELRFGGAVDARPRSAPRS